MNEWFLNTSWRFIDQSISGKTRSALESFATDDLLCEEVGNGTSIPCMRTWVHDSTIVLGIADHRLPHIGDAKDVLLDAGYRVIVRNSGGLAVVLDEGVLNISLLMSEADARIDIDAAYERMVDLVRALFPEIADQIEAYEIVGSYCPGSFDLSVGGKKFAGISQRRLRNGIAVQIYLCVEGNGAERAEVIRAFYEAGLQGETTKFTYPEIVPDVMASLSEIMEREVSVQEVTIQLQRLLAVWTDELFMSTIGDAEMERYMYYLTRVVERNKKMLGDG